MTNSNLLLTGSTGFASVTVLPELVAENFTSVTDTVNTIAPVLPDLVLPTANSTNLTQTLIQIVIAIVTLFGLLKKKKTT